MQEVADKGFDNASPLARLVAACESERGIVQGAAPDIWEVIEEIDGLRAANERMTFALRDIREQCEPGTFAHIAAGEGLGE
jgi:hypothetical protein